MRTTRSPDRRLLIIAAVLAVAIGAGVYFFFGRGGSGGPDMSGFAMPVEASPAGAQNVSVTLDTVGSLLADEEVVIRPEIAGRISAITFEEGTTVKKGDTLVTIDDAIYDAELKQAIARLELARSNFERAKTLKASGAATVRTFDEAGAELRTAEGVHALAKAKYDKTRIVAPFDGVVGLRKVSLGDYVNAGDDIVNFAKIDPLKVDFRVPETFLGRLKEGQKLDVLVDAFPSETFNGDLYAIDPLVDPQNRSVGARAHLPNSEGRLRPGQFAKVHVTLETRENAVVVPEEAIIPMGQDAFVMTIVDGKAQQVKVTLGERVEGKVEIRNGVKTGDVVITGGQIKIRPGMPVQVMPAPGAQGQGGPAPDGAKPQDKPEEKKE